MTPGARVAAAIEVLQAITDGSAAEQALTRWARRSRFAGSKDRAAVRDHVFDVLRTRSLAAHYGKGSAPRALMIGCLFAQDADLDTLFTGEGHAPDHLTAFEREFPSAPKAEAERWCLPDWLVNQFKASLGETAEVATLSLQKRAPVTLRVNSARAVRSDVQKILQLDGIITKPNPLSETALTVEEGARRIRNARAFQEGLVELQDASSQSVADAVPLSGRILDYCAGGGGKSLALAARQEATVFAHDIDARRMTDLTKRAARAGAKIPVLKTADLTKNAPFDTVLCDAPCSGSGAWRRNPEGKWTLTEERLEELTQIQDRILEKAASLVGHGGTLVYATCSLLRAENEDRVSRFLSVRAEWKEVFVRRFDVTEDGDGFFTSHLMRDK